MDGDDAVPRDPSEAGSSVGAEDDISLATAVLDPVEGLTDTSDGQGEPGKAYMNDSQGEPDPAGMSAS